MSTSTTKKVSARERARQAILEKQRAAQERANADQSDLAAIFRAQESVDVAEAKREKAISDARAACEATRLQAEASIASGLVAIANRGTKADELAELTGLSVSDVRRLIKSGKESAQSEVSTAGANDGGQQPEALGTAPDDEGGRTAQAS